jgi:hypothetical protein
VWCTLQKYPVSNTASTSWCNSYYNIGVLGFDSRRGLGIFIFTTAMSRTALGPTQPPIQWVPGALPLGVKRPGREVDHSPPSSAEVKNEWSYTSITPYASMAWWSVKAHGQLYLYITVTTTQQHIKEYSLQHDMNTRHFCCAIFYTLSRFFT